jgi:hypothetical protein
MRVDGSGDLIPAAARGEIRQRRPEIAGTSWLAGWRKRISPVREVRFEIGSYDPRLTIWSFDPVTYSTYLVGSGTVKLNAMALDASGNVYLTGQVPSPDCPASAPTQTQAGNVVRYSNQDRAASWAQGGPGGCGRRQLSGASAFARGGLFPDRREPGSWIILCRQANRHRSAADSRRRRCP